MISLDIVPTALAAAGSANPPSRSFDGMNLLPLLTGANGRAPHETLFWRYNNAIALRKGKWKLVRQAAGPKATDAAFELYNLEADIGEKQNLAAVERQTASALRAELERLNTQMAAPLW